jgi:hypothetical protein
MNRNYKTLLDFTNFIGNCLNNLKKCRCVDNQRN